MSTDTPPPTDRLSDILAEVKSAGDGDTVFVRDILGAVGKRSFGALLLVPSVLVISPFSGVPGVPTTAALVILLICGQYLLGRRTVWLPDFLMRRSMQRTTLTKAIDRTMPIMRRMDRIVKPRWSFLLGRAMIAVLAIIIAVLAAMMPPLELLPFVATTTGILIALLSLALLARDGLLAMVALALTGAAGAGIVLVIFPAVTSLLT